MGRDKFFCIWKLINDCQTTKPEQKRNWFTVRCFSPLRSGKAVTEHCYVSHSGTQEIFMLITPFSLHFQASSFSSMLHFMHFLQPCSAAVCFASCGLLAPIIRPSTIESRHQVNKSPRHCRLPLDPTVLLSVASTWVSAQLTVSASPLAGMTMAPHLEGHEIAFNASDRKSWRKYARSMDEYLKCESLKIVGDTVKVCVCVCVGGYQFDESIQFVSNEAGMQWVNPQLPLSHFFLRFLQGMLGKEASLWAEGTNWMCFFFSRPALLALLNQRPEAGRALL